MIVPGNEADDVIYRLAQSRSHLKETTYVISDDSDYFHFINLGNVKVFRAMKDEYWDAKVFEEKMGYPVTHYLLALSLTGTHNGVPGIKGIGEATAAKIMKKIATPTLENLYNCLEYDRSHYSRKIIDEWPLVKRNLYLIDPDKLPMTVDDVNNFYEKAKQSASLDLKYVLEQFKRFDFQSLTNIFSWLSTRE